MMVNLVLPPCVYRFLPENMFHFTCFNVDDPNDPSVGLMDGQLVIPGALLRREVYVSSYLGDNQDHNVSL